MARIESLTKLRELRSALQAKRDLQKNWIAVCAGTGCRACGAEEVLEALKRELTLSGLEGEWMTQALQRVPVST